MKIPPLKEMEPLPPVPELPACSHIEARADGPDDICELSSDSDVDDGEDGLPEGASLASAEAGSFLDMDLPKVCSRDGIQVLDSVCKLVTQSVLCFAC